MTGTEPLMIPAQETLASSQLLYWLH